MYLEIHRFSFEWKILEFFNKIGNTFFNYFFYLVSELGSSIILIILITLIYYCVNKEIGKRIAFITFFSITLNNVFKACFNALRPFQYPGRDDLRALKDTHLSDKASGTSFPSGHSQNSSSFYASIYLNFKHIIIRVLCIVIMILVPVSRLYLGVHFPGDVACGIVLGLFTTFILNYLLSKFPHKHLLIIGVSFIIFIPFIFLPNIAKDYFKGFGMLLGLFVATFLDQKYINYSPDGSISKKILRYLFGMLIVGITYLIIHIINHLDFIEEIHYLLLFSNFITHFILIIIGMALVPYLFNKIPFLKEENTH